MKLAGIDLQQALVFFGILALMITLLYLVKMRRRRITVPFSPLWGRVLTKQKGSIDWRQFLKRTLSLLLQVFIALLLVLAMTDPRPEVEMERGRSISVIIDTSASMSAIDPKTGKTRFELAREKAHKIIDGLGRHDRMSLIAMDGQVRSVTGDFTSKKVVLSDALDALSTSETEAQLLEALRNARDALEDRQDPEMILISDNSHSGNTKLPALFFPPKMAFHHEVVPAATDNDAGDENDENEGSAAGKRGLKQGNISVSGFNIRRYISNKLDYELYIQVRNHFEEPICVELSLFNLSEMANNPNPEKVTPNPSQNLDGSLQNYIRRPIALDDPSTQPEEKGKKRPQLEPCIAKEGNIAFEVSPGGQRLRFYPKLPTATEHIEAEVRLASRKTSAQMDKEHPERASELSPERRAEIDALAAQQERFEWVDALEVDDHAYVLVPQSKRARILAVTPGNLYLKAALLLNENYDVHFIELPQDPSEIPEKNLKELLSLVAKAQGPDGEMPSAAKVAELLGESAPNIKGEEDLAPPDVVIYDNSYWTSGSVPIAPSLDAPGHYIYINPRGDEAPFKVVREIKNQVLLYRLNRRHPITRWLSSLKESEIKRGAALRARRSLSSSDRRDRFVARSPDGDIILTHRSEGQSLVGIGFSIAESDLGVRITLPVLMLNSIDWLLDESGSLIEAYKTGESWHLPVPPGVQQVTIRGPEGNVDANIPTHKGDVVYYGARAGFYTLSPSTEEGSPTPALSWKIAANFASARESDLRPNPKALPEQKPQRIELETPTEEDSLSGWSWVFKRFNDFDLWMYFILITITLLLVEWLTFHRRHTV